MSEPTPAMHGIEIGLRKKHRQALAQNNHYVDHIRVEDLGWLLDTLTAQRAEAVVLIQHYERVLRGESGIFDGTLGPT